MYVTPQTSLTELAKIVELGQVHDRRQMMDLPGGGQAHDPNAPVVITRISEIKIGRAKGYARYDGTVLRLDAKGYSGMVAERQGEGFVTVGGMFSRGGIPVATVADWDRAIRTDVASLLRASH